MPHADAKLPDPDWATVARGAVAGLAAGLIASLAMNQFQALVSKLSSDEGSGGESSTAKAGDGIAKFATGKPIPDDSKEIAGNVVHYALGGALGLAYGVAAEFRPAVTQGFGTGLSLSTFALLDEAAVPATGLTPPPTQTSLSEHGYALASHLVFGTVTELTRRGIRTLLPPTD